MFGVNFSAVALLESLQATSDSSRSEKQVLKHAITATLISVSMKKEITHGNTVVQLCKIDQQITGNKIKHLQKSNTMEHRAYKPLFSWLPSN